MLHLIQRTERYRYNPALFAILGGQPEELTHLQLLQRMMNYVAARQLSNYDLRSGKAWLDTTDTGIRTIMGLPDSTDRFVMWDAGQRLSGWREIVDIVHVRWSEPVLPVSQHTQEDQQGLELHVEQPASQS